MSQDDFDLETLEISPTSDQDQCGSLTAMAKYSNKKNHRLFFFVGGSTTTASKTYMYIYV